MKGLTHSISYNVITTTCIVLASAAQANTTPMQKPNSTIGHACLSSTVLTAHNILLPAGVTSRIALRSLCLWYSDRNVSLPTLKSPSFRAFVLLHCCIDIRTKSNTDECGKFTTYRIHNFVTLLSSCLGLRVLGSKPNQSSRPGNSNTVTTLSCKRLPTRQQKTDRTYKSTGQQQYSSTGIAA